MKIRRLLPLLLLLLALQIPAYALHYPLGDGTLTRTDGPTNDILTPRQMLELGIPQMLEEIIAMGDEKVNALLAQFRGQIPNQNVLELHDLLKRADDSQYAAIAATPIYDRNTTLILSIFLGGFGADRFYIDDTALGVCKLLFGWATLYIWPFVDIFLSYKAAERKNMEALRTTISR